MSDLRSFSHSAARRSAARLVPLALGAWLGCVAACAAEETPEAVAPPPAPVQAQAPVTYAAASAPPVTYVAAPAPAQAAQVAYASAVPAAVAPAAQVTPGTSLPYGEFLANGDDEAKRQRFWALFQRAEPEARAFASSPSRWIPIRRVEYATLGHSSGDWTADGTIAMKPENDAGLMFHEMFHPVFHPSEFHLMPNGVISHTDRDGAWSEAWCDAFRYYAERELLPEPRSGWVQRMDRLTQMTEAQVMAEGDSFTKRKYTYPASLIVKRNGGASGSMTTLRALWFDLIAKRAQAGAPVMDAFFGFAPPLHKGDA